LTGKPPEKTLFGNIWFTSDAAETVRLLVWLSPDACAIPSTGR